MDDVVAVVELPVPADDVLFAVGVDRVVVGRPRDRRQDHELDRVDVVLEREVRGRVDRLQVVLVGAHHEHAVDPDSVGVEALDRALDLAEVLLLVEELERARIDGLEADVDVEAVRVTHELEELGVVHGLGSHLRAPLRRQVPGDHPVEQLLHALLVRREDVVGEERVEVAPVALELLQHARHRMGPERVAVHARNRAEGAREGAAPRRGDRDDAARLPARDEVIAEIATRSAESTSSMSTGWMSSMYTRTSYPLVRMIDARRTEPSRGMQTRL